MEFTKEQKVKIINMITKGEKMEDIALEISGDCTLNDIQKFCWETGYMSWQGSKKMISTRLKRFENASKKSERKRLAKEIDKSVSYLYNSAKQMRSRLIVIEKALKKIT